MNSRLIWSSLSEMCVGNGAKWGGVSWENISSFFFFSFPVTQTTPAVVISALQIQLCGQLNRWAASLTHNWTERKKREKNFARKAHKTLTDYLVRSDWVQFWRNRQLFFQRNYLLWPVNKIKNYFLPEFKTIIQLKHKVEKKHIQSKKKKLWRFFLKKERKT